MSRRVFNALLLALIPPLMAQEPPSAEKTVAVRGRTLSLPLFPRSLRQAHLGYQAFQTQAIRNKGDLDVDIERLQSDPLARGPLPPLIETSFEQQEEVNFLKGMFKDLRYQQLEQGVIELWKQWKQLLIQNELRPASPEPWTTTVKKTDPQKNNPVGPPTTTLPLIATEFQVPIATLESLAAAEGTEYLNARFNPLALRTQTNRNTTVPLGLKPTLGLAHVDPLISPTQLNLPQENSLDRSILLQGLYNQMAPRLATAWSPLAKYMNDCAGRLLELETQANPEESLELKQLRLRAKLAFLKRFREDLQFMEVVWQGMVGIQAFLQPSQEMSALILQARSELQPPAKIASHQRAEGSFQPSILKVSTVGLWPKAKITLDECCRRLIEAEYGTVEEFHEDLMDRLTTGLISGFGPGSRSSSDLVKELSDLSSHPLFEWPKNANAEAFLVPLRQSPALSSLPYLLVCRNLNLTSHPPQGRAKGSLPWISGHLEVAVLECSTGKMAWESQIDAETPLAEEWVHGFHATQDALLNRLFALLQ